MLGLYGEADTGIAPEDVRRFEAELRKINPSVEFVLYPGAPHAFFSDDRPNYLLDKDRICPQIGENLDPCCQSPSEASRLRAGYARTASLRTVSFDLRSSGSGAQSRP